MSYPANPDSDKKSYQLTAISFQFFLVPRPTNLAPIFILYLISSPWKNAKFILSEPFTVFSTYGYNYAINWIYTANILISRFT